MYRYAKIVYSIIKLISLQIDCRDILVMGQYLGRNVKHMELGFFQVEKSRSGRKQHPNRFFSDFVKLKNRVRGVNSIRIDFFRKLKAVIQSI